MLRLGAHMSIAGGLPRAVERARAVRATALQVFVKSSNQWAARPFAPGEVEAFRRDSLRADLQRHTLAHASYLINLASPDRKLWRRSLEALIVELDRCAALGIPYLVLHPGAHVGRGPARGIGRVVRGLDRALSSTTATNGAGPILLLENTAGQGTHLGTTFEQLARILDAATATERLGICFDTCHALAAGYELRTDEGYRRTFDELDRLVGLPRVRAFHLNDSKTGLGSRRDRHEHIGRGHVGREGFRRLMTDGRFHGLPMVIETPKQRDPQDDRRNLEVLRRLAHRTG